jgi:hypothetical protein
MKMQEKMDKFEKELNLDLEKLELMVEQIENKYNYVEIRVYKHLKADLLKEFAEDFLKDCEDYDDLKNGLISFDEEDEESADNDNE